MSRYSPRLLSSLALLPLEPRNDTPHSDYDRARRALLRYDQVLRRSSERVERACDQLRRHQARRELARLLPEVVLPVRGPAGGLTGARLALHNRREDPAELRFHALPFRVAGRELEVSPGLGVRPYPLVLVPGESRAVTLWLDFSSTSFEAGELVYGDVEVLAHDQVELRVCIEATLYADSG